MIKAIIFDADGMIVHGERFSARLEKEQGISTNTTEEFFKTSFQKCLVGKADLQEELEKNIKNWGWKGNVQELLDFWFDEQANSIDKRFESVIPDLKKKNILCFLATNNEKYRTENLLETRGLKKWFDDVFSSTYLGCKKPEKEFFQKILGKYPNLRKEEIIFVDDDLENVDGAKNFGFKTEIYQDFEDFTQKLSNLLILPS